MRRQILLVVCVLLATLWLAWPERSPAPVPLSMPIASADVRAATAPSAVSWRDVGSSLLPPLAPPLLTPPPLASPRTLVGRVVDQYGAAIANAFVGTTANNSDAVHSDAEGGFLLRGLPAGVVQIFAGAAGFADGHLTVSPHAGDATLTLHPASVLRVRLARAPEVELMASMCRPGNPGDDEPFCSARVIVPPGQIEFAFTRLAGGHHELRIEYGEQLLLKLPVDPIPGTDLLLEGVELPAADFATPVAPP
jgi:Carboxypeptidase regulatory-like domain